MNLLQAAKKVLGLSGHHLDQRHLAFDSLEAWQTGPGLPEDWTRHPDQTQRDLWWKQFTELKEHLWQKHIASLSDEEQKQFKDGTHPSMSHAFHDRARPFCDLLREELKKQGIDAAVKIGFYHMDRIVLSAYLAELPPGGLPGSPWLFRGFEVKAARGSAQQMLDILSQAVQEKPDPDDRLPSVSH